MGSFSGLGIGLSFVFGCILMGLVAELYYLLYWKKRIEGFCLKKNPISSQEQEDLEMGSSKDLGLIKGYGEEGIETELMRAHNLCGPPRFLFTIKEEDDLESEDGKSRSSRKGSRTNLSLSPNNNFYHNHNGFNNPLFESLSEAEVNRLRSSPPPKFKFLKDAEDKLIRRLLVEEAQKKKGLKNVQDSENSRNESQEEKDVCFLKLSQQEAPEVLPLDSSSSSSPILKPQEQ